MDSLLLIVACGAGIASLFLVADMIATDLADRRAERSAACRVERQAAGRAGRREER
jgi:galactitol-specific phosphotransferase system IIB component